MIKPKRQSPKPVSGVTKPAKTTPSSKASSSTKIGQLEALLRRPEGATIAVLAKTLDWQPHSVRGAMSGFLKKKRGLKIGGEKAEGGERVYRILE